MPTRPDIGTNAEIIRQGVKQRSAVIESGLCQWIEANTSPSDACALAVALLRMGVNGHIGLLGEVEAMTFLGDMFSREMLRVMQ